MLWSIIKTYPTTIKRDMQVLQKSKSWSLKKSDVIISTPNSIEKNVTSSVACACNVDPTGHKTSKCPKGCSLWWLCQSTKEPLVCFHFVIIFMLLDISKIVRIKNVFERLISVFLLVHFTWQKWHLEALWHVGREGTWIVWSIGIEKNDYIWGLEDWRGEKRLRFERKL